MYFGMSLSGTLQGLVMLYASVVVFCLGASSWPFTPST